MSPKVVITISIFVFGTIGGYIPALFGDANLFSFSSVMGNLIGGIVGIYVGYRINRDYL